MRIERGRPPQAGVIQTMSDQFVVHFWGVRGSIPCPGPATVRYGGNTPCVEMVVAGKRLIFDGGTGLRVLGQHLLERMPFQAHMFFTHTHWDHIHGFPFFAPAFADGNELHIYGTTSADGSTIKERLTIQMRHPNFPVPLREMGAQLHFHDLKAGVPVELNGITVETAPLNHPGQATGYRVNWSGRSAAYITDTEHFEDHLDENVLRLARDVNVLIMDTTYTDAEYHAPGNGKQGWGHSTWQEAVKVAKAANAGRLVAFHHDPQHNDAFLDEVGETMGEAFPDSYVAREGLSIQIPLPKT